MENMFEKFWKNNRKTIVIQGIGFVGTAMIAAVSNAKNDKEELLYNVIGIDLPDEKNLEKIQRVNSGIPPIVSADKSLDNAYSYAHQAGNLIATTDKKAYEIADIVVVDINLDIRKKALGEAENYQFTYENYLRAMTDIAENIREETLIIIESTVPPGTTSNVIYPRLKAIVEGRGLDINKIYLAHSYERVMPGEKYLDSITNFYRVFSGIDEKSMNVAEAFLKSFINTNEYPLRKLKSTTASEMSKVLENSFRAMNIAFIQEWTEYAELAGVDLFEVIDAIRDRPTHKNIMAPGLGVGGYCLTKDALLADYGYSEIFKSGKRLSMSIAAINTNDLMPKHSFELFEKRIENLGNLKVAILGVSYLNDVGDTRYTPLGLFYDLLLGKVKEVTLFDPYVDYWVEKNIYVNTELYADPEVDCVVFTVRHKQYASLGAVDIKANFPQAKYIFDTNNVLTQETASALLENGITYLSVGRGN